MSRYTKTDVRSIVKQIEVEAMQAGLLPNGARLVYSPGNPTNGISATIDAFSESETGGRKYESINFLPEFTYKDTAQTQYRLLFSTLNVFHSLRWKREREAAE